MASSTRLGGSRRCGEEAAAVLFGAACSALPAKKGSSAFTNGTRSCGPRLVSQLPSRTTSWSTQVAPAFTRSSRTPGHEAMRRPFVRPADESTHGPWHSVAIGFPVELNSRTKSRAAADSPRSQRNDVHLGASCAQGCHRHGKFYLLETVRRQHGNASALKLLRDQHCALRG